MALLWGCSTRKDTFVNRNWHALNTEFNVLYNGHNALAQGVEKLNSTYVDNYWELLPVERMEISEEIKVAQESSNPNFNRAEEKATKAIQKHGMEIKNRERNPQIDEAFLLLGKARYYDQRFVPALEAFNYILYKYPNSSQIAQAKIWREKTNIRLENEELALENLKRLLKQEKLSDQDYADASAMMGQAYINLKYLDSAARRLRVAAAATKKNEEKGRYYYIVGQLHNRLGSKDTANMAFNKVIELNRKSPRAYMINAEIEKLKNTNFTAQDKELTLEQLTALEENRENRPFLDKIYNQIAEYYSAIDSTDAAITYYNKSLRAIGQDAHLRALNYERLGEINFYNHQFKNAGAYYDSTLLNLNENVKKYRTIKRKRNNLEDVIKYEGIVQHNDSVLYLVNASAADRIAYFEEFIAELKAKEEAEAEKKELEALQQNTGSGFGVKNTSGGASAGGTFYFYNAVTVGYGKTEFKKQWGERALEDNWRLSDKTIIADEEIVAANTPVGQEQPASAEEKYSVDYYVNQIPTNTQHIDSLVTERNFANYQLGLIYKEQFKEYGLAANKLKKVLQSNPEEKLILPSKYNLYKIYQLQNNSMAAAIKKDILDNYSNSNYAEILRNPETILSADSKNNPEVIYTQLYKKYENQEFEAVIASTQIKAKTFNGQDMGPKFEMLGALAKGRLQGFTEFKKALSAIALNYPNTPEGKEAKNMVDNYLPKIANTTFKPSVEKGKYKLVFPFIKRDTAAIGKLNKTLEKSLKELNYSHLKISTDIYNSTQTFLVVHGFPQKEHTLGYVELLNINKEYKVDNENFVILSDNYKIVQIHKNLDDYLKQVLTPNTN
jgi:tetratricopeptide (TPR) repeat protein